MDTETCVVAFCTNDVLTTPDDDMPDIFCAQHTGAIKVLECVCGATYRLPIPQIPAFLYEYRNRCPTCREKFTEEPRFATTSDFLTEPHKAA
jgi:hypothetical protein